METTQSTTPNLTPWQRAISRLWLGLSWPGWTVGSLAAIGLVLLLYLLLPQQGSGSLADWTTNLSPTLRPWRDTLHNLGLAHLLSSGWFWGPVALLTLNSLVALAQYGQVARQRMRPTADDLRLYHPLAHRRERVVRLPYDVDGHLTDLQTSLTDLGFITDPQADEADKQLAVSRYQWAWAAPVALYSGLLVLVLALLISHYSLGLEPLTLLPHQTSPSLTLNGSLTLGDTAHRLQFNPTGSSSGQTLAWNLYQPRLFRGSLLLPINTVPVVTFAVLDETSSPVTLLPGETQLPPTRQLSLRQTGPEPSYFFIPIADTAARVNLSEGEIDIQLRQPDTEQATTHILQPGDSLTFAGLTLTSQPNQQLSLLIYRDPAWPLYLLSLALVLGGGLVWWRRPPWQLWLIPEVKGRGGQLYGVAESLAPAHQIEQLLAQVVVEEEAEE